MCACVCVSQTQEGAGVLSTAYLPDCLSARLLTCPTACPTVCAMCATSVLCVYCKCATCVLPVSLRVSLYVCIARHMCRANPRSYMRAYMQDRIDVLTCFHIRVHARGCMSPHTKQCWGQTQDRTRSQFRRALSQRQKARSAALSMSIPTPKP